MKSLQRALAAGNPPGCWASRAMDYRRQRFALMDPMFVSYERGTELNEGLAAYIQFKASGAKEFVFPVDPFMPTQIRQRAYVAGPALALLLDRFEPGWSFAFEQHDEDTLDSLLGTAIAKSSVKSDKACSFTALELTEAKKIATDDVEQIAIRRKELREALDQGQGWRVIVQASESSPLWPQGFDPINVELLEDGLLHKRWLRLGNDAGQLDAIDGKSADISALTRRAGEHPLYNGVSWVMITGLDAPKIDSQNGVVTISAPGFDARFSNATAHTEEQEVTLTLK